MCEQLDPAMEILLGRRELAWDELPERPVNVRPVKPLPEVTGGRRKPSADHPWRQPDQASQATPTTTSTSRPTK